MKLIRMSAQDYRLLTRTSAKTKKPTSYTDLIKKRAQGPKEHELQKAIVKNFRNAGFKVYLMDAMTGVGYFGQDDDRRFAFIADLKRRGYEKGQPDICVVRNKVWFLELKRPRHGKASDEQKDMGQWLIDHGHNYALISSIEEANRIITNPNA